MSQGPGYEHLPLQLDAGLLDRQQPLYSPYTHDYVATHDSNIIIKYSDVTTLEGLICTCGETAYRKVVLEGRQPFQDEQTHAVAS